MSDKNTHTSYLSSVMSLEERLTAVFNELGVSEDQRERILKFLGQIETKHRPTFEHSIRVGLIACRIASFLQMDARALLYAGLTHDIGKALVALEVLNKTEGWTSEDTKAMMPHVEDGCRMLAGVFDFSADIILWHHRYQAAGYPEILPEPLHEYSEGTKALISTYGRVLALADTYDAFHRINDKHDGTVQALTGDEIKTAMLKCNPDRQDLIKQLYLAGIFTTFIDGEIHQETVKLDMGDTLYDQSWQYTPEARTPSCTRRYVELAAALEAISDKAGCTTRLKDVSRHLKLPYFVTAGINIGEAFEALATHVEKHKCAAGVYEFTLRAQWESKRNRRGGRVNQGLIELLTPIVAAQHLYDAEYQKNGFEILSLVTAVLRNTNRKDIDDLVAMKRLAHGLSHYDDREVPEYSSANTVYDYYKQDLDASEGATSIAHNGEFVDGFPIVKLMYTVLMNSPYPDFNNRVEEAYHLARAKYPSDVAAGLLADCIAVAIYLQLSQHPQDRVIG